MKNEMTLRPCPYQYITTCYGDIPRITRSDGYPEYDRQYDLKKHCGSKECDREHKKVNAERKRLAKEESERQLKKVQGKFLYTL